MSEEREEYKTETANGQSKLSDLLSCRVRRPGEIMRCGDIVLMNDRFVPLGFNTDYHKYFAGQEVLATMKYKVICEAR